MGEYELHACNTRHSVARPPVGSPMCEISEEIGSHADNCSDATPPPIRRSAAEVVAGVLALVGPYLRGRQSNEPETMISEVGAGLPPAGSAVIAMVVVSVPAATTVIPGSEPEQAERDRRAAIDRPELVGRAVVEGRQALRVDEAAAGGVDHHLDARAGLAGEGGGLRARRVGGGLGVALDLLRQRRGLGRRRLANDGEADQHHDHRCRDRQDDPGEVRVRPRRCLASRRADRSSVPAARGDR